jgi:hypothetical protein
MNRAIAYAEDTLGVHRTWTDVQALQAQLNDLYQMHAGFLSESRKLEWESDNRRNQILVEESSNNPEMTPTAFERHMRLAYAGDETLEAIAKLKVDVMARRDGAEASIKSVERNHVGHVARLKELGGYFEFLAVTKAAQMQVAVAVQNANESPW